MKNRLSIVAFLILSIETIFTINKFLVIYKQHFIKQLDNEKCSSVTPPPLLQKKRMG